MKRETLDKYIEILEQQTALFDDDEYEEGMEAIRELKALALRATDPDIVMVPREKLEESINAAIAVAHAAQEQQQ